MRFIEELRAALAAQLATLGALTPDQLAVASACPDWSVGQVTDHSLGVTNKFTAFADGATDAPRTPAGPQFVGSPGPALRAAGRASDLAWASCDPARRCELPFGTFPAELAAGINLFDVLAHTWDAASPLGLQIRCADSIWEAGLAAARAVIDGGRDLAHYGSAHAVDPAAPAATHFLAYLGRVG